MDHPTTNVLLIEDNPGDADLVRLRLVEGSLGSLNVSRARALLVLEPGVGRGNC